MCNLVYMPCLKSLKLALLYGKNIYDLFLTEERQEACQALEIALNDSSIRFSSFVERLVE